jgi:mannose-6-phosphate isomerase-like protein (cupin superfamily)
MHTWSVTKGAVAEHQGTAASTYLIEKEQLQAETANTYLGLASVFEVAPGATLRAHHHPTHEYWFVLDGTGVMQVADEAKRIEVGELIYTPPNTPHMVRNDGDVTFRAFCFAQSYEGQGSQHVDVDLEPVELTE